MVLPMDLKRRNRLGGGADLLGSFYISAENSCTSPCESALNTTEPQIFGSFEDKL
jgi:hypothetical protein